MNVIQKKRVTWSTLRAFGRIDLAGTLAALMLLAMLMVACGAMNRTATESAVCRNNHRRLMAAWIAHAQENPTVVIPAGGGASVYPSAWGLGWLDWSTNSVNTNVNGVLTKNFMPYVGRDPSVFRCPSDGFLSSQQQDRGWRHRVRSYSINSSFGLENTGATLYSRIQHMAQPAATFVFAEEHPGSINDSMLLVDVTGGILVDVLGSFHDRSANLGFADGHVELHRWVGTNMTQTVEPGRYTRSPLKGSDPDVRWVLDRAIQPR